MRSLQLLVLLIATSQANGLQVAEDHSFKVRTINHVYDSQPVTSVKEVDWENFTYHLFWTDTLRPCDTKTAPLKSGEFVLEPSRTERRPWQESTYLGSVDYCEEQKPEEMLAVVPLGFVAVGGSSTSRDLTQVFTTDSGRLKLVGEIVNYFLRRPHDVTKSERFYVDCEGKSIRIASQYWTEWDAHCCPSKVNIGTFSFSAGEIKLESVRQVDVSDYP
jgi:hypothetical protein